MNRKTSAFMLLVIAIALIPSVYAEYPIENLKFIQKLPTTLIAGNTYCMNVTFDNVAKESVALTIYITVSSEEPLGLGEVLIDEIKLNGVILDCDEEDPGFFTTEGTLTPTSHNKLDITTSTVINLMPGVYTFEVDLLGEEMTEPPKPRPPRPVRNILPVADAGSNQTVDVGQFVEFSGVNSTDPDGYLLSWTWDFGDGTEASGVNVSHAYSEPGNYTVMLTVVDVRYGEDNDTCIVTVREIPPIIVPPLPPILDNLVIIPLEFELGNSVTISLDIINIDSQSFSYEFTMEIGDLTLLVDVELEPYESKTVSRIITPTAIGTYNVTAIGLTGSFTVSPPLIPLKPAEFVLSELRVVSAESGLDTPIEVGGQAIFCVKVTNIGETEGNYTVEFKVDGEVIYTQDLTIAAGIDRYPMVRYEALNAGTYQVSVEDLTKTLTVLEPEPEPAEFNFSNLRITLRAKEGSVTISIDTTNIGDIEGSHIIKLVVDGVVVTSKEISLLGGGMTTVEFELTRGEGIHEVEVEGLTESFTIVLPEPDLEPPFWTGPKIAVIMIVVIGGIIIVYMWSRRGLEQAGQISGDEK